MQRERGGGEGGFDTATPAPPSPSQIFKVGAAWPFILSRAPHTLPDATIWALGVLCGCIVGCEEQIVFIVIIRNSSYWSRI